MALRLIREEGLLVGGSSGTNVVAALRLARSGELCGPVVTCCPTPGIATEASRGCADLARPAALPQLYWISQRQLTHLRPEPQNSIALQVLSGVRHL